jgi:hypothetical protein
MNYSVKPVQTGADWNAFLQVPHQLQGHDPFWVAPMHFMVKDQLNPKKNPWFKHGEAAFWTIEKDGKLAGRISAQVDQSHLALRKDDTGFFGFFETADDQEVANALFETACAWLKQRGMKRALGPFSLNINEESGLLVDGFECPPRMMMGHTQPYYGKRVEGAGFTKAIDMLAYLTPMDTALPYKHYAWLKRQLDRNPRFALRKLDVKKIDEEIATVVKLFNEAWIENWNFIPLVDDDLKHLVKELKLILLPELVSFGTFDGEVVAMCVALPDLNEMIRGLNGKMLPFNWAKLLWRVLRRRTVVAGTRVPFMGVKPEYKNKTMGSVLAVLTVDAVRRASLDLHMPICEMSWVLDNNHQTRHSIESIGGRIYKTYRMYEKAL